MCDSTEAIGTILNWTDLFTSVYIFVQSHTNFVMYKTLVRPVIYIFEWVVDNGNLNVNCIIMTLNALSIIIFIKCMLIKQKGYWIKGQVMFD